VTKEIFETLLEDEVGDEEKWENIGSKMWDSNREILLFSLHVSFLIN
jgi:hypothetical protein